MVSPKPSWLPSAQTGHKMSAANAECSSPYTWHTSLCSACRLRIITSDSASPIFVNAYFSRRKLLHQFHTCSISADCLLYPLLAPLGNWAAAALPAPGCIALVCWYIFPPAVSWLRLTIVDLTAACRVPSRVLPSENLCIGRC